MPRLPYRGDRLQFSRDRVSAYWKRAGWQYAKRLGKFALFGPGAVAVAGLSNLLTKVPQLDTMPRMIGMKRRRGRDPTNKNMEAAGGVLQKVDYKYSRGGRRVGKTRRLLKHLSAHVAPLVERWSLCESTLACATIADAVASMKGALFLNSGLIDAATTYGYPVYLFDLTGVYNNHAGLGLRYPTVAHRLTQVAATGNMAYTAIPGANALDGANDTYSWLTERLTKASGLLRAGPTAMIDGFKLDMTTFGASKLPSEIYVELWRFKDEQLCPSNNTGSSVLGGPGGGPHTPDQRRMDEFWRQRLAKMVGKMDHKGFGAPTVDDGVEIKRIAHFTYQPQLSTEAVQAGHQKNLHYFHRWNKQFKYDHWNTESTSVIPGDIDNPDVFESELAADTMMAFPKQSSRWFLVVRGDVAVQNSTSGAATNRDLFPSFDIVIRRYRRLIKD